MIEVGYLLKRENGYRGESHVFQGIIKYMGCRWRYIHVRDSCSGRLVLSFRWFVDKSRGNTENRENGLIMPVYKMAHPVYGMMMSLTPGNKNESRV